MRILWHAVAPWVPTGYGMQTAMWAPRFRDMGHEVTISAYFGLWGSPMYWESLEVLPGSNHPYGDDVLAARAVQEKADLILTLMDIWVLSPQQFQGLNVAHWMPVDTRPLSQMDAECLRISGAKPIAMSRHGETMLREAGFDPLYVPHAVDTAVYQPLGENRKALREEMRIDDKFVIGINAANKDPFRKGCFEQLVAFSRLHAKHPDTMLLIHSLAKDPPNGLDLAALVEHLDIKNAVGFTNQYEYSHGRMSPQHLVKWYNVLDLYSQASMGEGFGLTSLEAMACGVPVVVTDASSMPEIAADAGWKVSGEPFWNPKHLACWVKPNISQLTRVYEQAYQRGKPYQDRKKKAVKNALRYEVSTVRELYWKPALKELEDSLL